MKVYNCVEHTYGKMKKFKHDIKLNANKDYSCFTESDIEKQDWNDIFKNTTSICVSAVKILALIIFLFGIFQFLMSRYYLIIKILFYIGMEVVIQLLLVSKEGYI